MENREQVVRMENRKPVSKLENREQILKEMYPEDILKFSESLTDGEIVVLQRVRKAVDEHLRPVINDYWKRGEFPFEEFKHVANTGLISDPALFENQPNRFMWRNTYFLFLAYDLYKFDASIATFFGVHAGLGYFSFLLGGSPEQQMRWLPKLQNFELQTCFALTEPEHGSDTAAGLATTASREGDKWIINGEKRWVGGASSADLIPVYARDLADNKVKCFIVEKGQKGLSVDDIDDKIALRIVQNGNIHLDNVEVAESNRLQNINGFKDVAKVLYATRAGVAYAGAGMMAGSLEAALEYTTNRVQFGKPIASFQLVQEKLARMQANAVNALALSARLAELQERGEFSEINASLAKMNNSLRLRETAALGREVCGGNGITLERNVARFFCDAEAIYSYEGTHEMNALIIGRKLTGISAFV